MSSQMRWEQCCTSRDCTKPAHIGELCAPCFMAATPARRATELLAQPTESIDTLEVTWLLTARDHPPLAA
jgi:hypothetical protein